MIQAPSPALPWLLEGRHKETIATLARVRDFLPEDATIHSRPRPAGMRPADIEFPLPLPSRARWRSASGGRRGAIVEAALDVAAMPEYGAYSLFESAHNTVNVPAAFRELQDAATEKLKS